MEGSVSPHTVEQVKCPTESTAPTSQTLIQAPIRRAKSVRRTSTIDVVWPEGNDAPALYRCTGRDIYTESDNSTPRILDEASAQARCLDRTIIKLSSAPSVEGLERMHGATAGGKLRGRLSEVLTNERCRGDLLYLLLDDLSGTTLVSRWGLYRWLDESAVRDEDARTAALIERMTNVCHSFQPGLTALRPSRQQSARPPGLAIATLDRADDPEGWHSLVEISPINFRRARLIDVWVHDGLGHVEALFQDSARDPEGGRRALHEYRLKATFDLTRQVLRSICAEAGNLPYPECPGAAANIQRLVNTPLVGLRQTVLERLAKAAGCTHLNDAIRALADVPRLLRDRDQCACR